MENKKQKYIVMADKTRRLNDIEKHTLLYMIASKEIAINGYYTYLEVKTGKKVMVLA